jgi:hypothetical protein
MNRGLLPYSLLLFVYFVYFVYFFFLFFLYFVNIHPAGGTGQLGTKV